MNKSIYIIILIVLFLSCESNSNAKKRNIITKNHNEIEKEYFEYSRKKDKIKMSEITVKEFIEELKVENKSELNILITIGKTDINWISKLDLKYLISKIESKERAKCVNRQISSLIPDSKNMTLGNQVISIIESYRKKEPYPNEIYICEDYDSEKINEIKKWWKQKNGS